MRVRLESEVLGERVVELFHRDLSVVVQIETAHEGLLLVVSHVHSALAEAGGELCEIENLVAILV